MLMNAVVVHDRHIACLPVVTDPVMNLVTGPIENVERRLVHVTVLLRPSAGSVFLQMNM